MKKVFFGFLLIFTIFLYLNTQKVDFTLKIEEKSELQKKFPIKKHHERLSLDCIFCHEGQGYDPKEFFEPDEKVCLSCHKSKKYLAQRLGFLDITGLNPHNSLHYGTSLSCDYCHHSHEESENRCLDCHHTPQTSEYLWMQKVP